MMKQKLRLIDYDIGSAELLDDEADESDNDDYDTKIIGESVDDSYSDNSSKDDDNETILQSQQDRQRQENNEEDEFKYLLLDLAELKKKIYGLLQKNRRLIKMINKSSNLT